MDRLSPFNSQDTESATTTSSVSENLTPRTLVINTSVGNEKEYTASNPFAIFDQEKGQWKCGKCRRFFKARKDLEQHLNSGTHDEIKYNCSECGRGFASIGALTLHCEQAGHIHRNWGMLQDVQTMLASPAPTGPTGYPSGHESHYSGAMMGGRSINNNTTMMNRMRVSPLGLGLGISHFEGPPPSTSPNYQSRGRGLFPSGQRAVPNAVPNVAPFRAAPGVRYPHIPLQSGPVHADAMCLLHIAAFTERGCIESGCALTLLDENRSRVIHQDAFVIKQFMTDSLQPEYDAIYEGLVQALDRGIVNLHVVTCLDVICHELNMNFQELTKLTETSKMASFALKIRRLMLEFRFVDIELVPSEIVGIEIQRSRETYFQFRAREIDQFQPYPPVPSLKSPILPSKSANISPNVSIRKNLNQFGTTQHESFGPTRSRGLDGSFGSHGSVTTLDTTSPSMSLGSNFPPGLGLGPGFSQHRSSQNMSLGVHVDLSLDERSNATGLSPVKPSVPQGLRGNYSWGHFSPEQQSRADISPSKLHQDTAMNGMIGMNNNSFSQAFPNRPRTPSTSDSAYDKESCPYSPLSATMSSSLFLDPVDNNTSFLSSSNVFSFGNMSFDNGNMNTEESISKSYPSPLKHSSFSDRDIFGETVPFSPNTSFT